MLALATTRIQLSLYVPPISALGIEHARRLLDPIQADLIPTHVTLCREDELKDIDLNTLNAIIRTSEARSITLKFGDPEVFQGHGILLPCIEGANQFQELRCCILGSRQIRRHSPHITVAHPRNPRSPQNVPANLSIIPNGLVITLASVCYIRQEAAAPWQILAEEPLASATSVVPADLKR